MILLQTLLWIAVIETGSTSDFCNGLVKTALPKYMMSTKTAYKFGQRDDTHQDVFENEVASCSAKQVWVQVRHGTRYPTRRSAEKLLTTLPHLANRIGANHIQGRGCLSDEDLSEITNWFAPFGRLDLENLQEQGSDEMYELGQRWAKLYSSLFKEEFQQEIYKVGYTVKNRTQQSAYHFLRGAFGDDAIGTIELPPASEPNFILRHYAACSRWLKTFSRKAAKFEEQEEFEKSAVFLRTRHAVSARLGFLHPLTIDELMSIYDECRYEIAWQPRRVSAWCAAFTVTDLEVLEYHQDLLYYYLVGPGVPINRELACAAATDLYNHFSKSVDRSSAMPHALLYFGHDKSMMLLMALLRLFEDDEPLTAQAFEDQQIRTWRTGFISPFAANLGFVLYKCRGDEHRVGLLFNEEPIRLPVCSSITCSWEELKNFLENVSKNCDLNKLCMIRDEL